MALRRLSVTVESQPTIEPSAARHGATIGIHARRAALTVDAVLVANLALRSIGALAVPGLSAFEPLGPVPVAATSVVVGLGGTAVYGLMGAVPRPT